ncbi:ABC transporter ATP-binding protein [Mesoterricola sediminis]|nr:ABC transporter ATP-binding protein [Mesoterricola sediminis]
MTTPAPATPRLAIRGVRKVYPSVVANDGVDLTILPGEIRAVLGENGAGKSTLMKIIYGVTRPDEGELLWEGRPVTVRDPAHARSLGIGMVFQHFSLFETLTVAQNVALAIPGKLDLKGLSRRIEEISERYGLPVDPRRLVHALSVGERQRVEIIRCLLQNPRLLILDEPTSVLTPQAVRRLFETLRQLASEGVSILYISHKLDEIQELCHTATVLRNGRVTGHCVPSQETPKSMARLMIGEDIPTFSHGEPEEGRDVRLRIDGLSLKSEDPFGVDLKDVNLEVRAGEIVGIAGVSGNGQQELLKAISGEEPVADRRWIQVCGVPAGRMNAARRRALGLCFVPEERLGRGAVPRLSLTENILLTAYRRSMLRFGMIRRKAARAFAEDCIRLFDVKCGGPASEAKSLSGGNLQKFIVGREILQEPKVLVLAQPTWGVDVGAASFIRKQLLALRESGTAVLVISEELDELFEICDRLVVIAKGRLSPAKATSETGVEEVGMWMSGLWPGAETAGGEGSHVA